MIIIKFLLIFIVGFVLGVIIVSAIIDKQIKDYERASKAIRDCERNTIDVTEIYGKDGNDGQSSNDK